MIKWRSVAAMLVALSGIPTTLVGQGVGTIEGTTVDMATEAPLSGVQIVLVGTDLGAISGSAGSFQLRNVPEGAYTVRAILMGYRAEDQAIRLGAGQTVRLTFSMAQTAVELEGLVVTALGIERQEGPSRLRFSR